MKSDERGHVIVEAAYVFPIAIFVVIFLVFLGNAYYLKAQIDDYTMQIALKGAEKCANPLSQEVEDGEINMASDLQMYRYISLFNSYMDSVEDTMEEELEALIQDANGSVFVGMEPEITAKPEATYKGNLVQPSFSIEVEYSVKTPFRFIFTDEDTIATIHSKAEVPVVDMGEFIGIIDMVEDYYENTGAKNACNGIKEKISELLGK